jgi:hypothetical protein
MATPDTPTPPSVRSEEWPCRHPAAVDPPPRLKAFLYRLVRDGAPAPGDVEHMALTVAGSTAETTYTNEHLEAYALALITFLLTPVD